MWISSAADGDSDFNNFQSEFATIGEEDTVIAWETDTYEDEFDIPDGYELHFVENPLLGETIKMYISVAGGSFYVETANGTFQYFGGPVVS